MSGIVRSDQMFSYHSGLRKSLRWYKKAGAHILEIFITNAFYLYRKFSSHLELCHLVEFREVIIKNLIGERKESRSMTPMANFHYPQTISDSKKKKKPTRRCRKCWKKEITICLSILRWSTTSLHWFMFPIVPQRHRNIARFVKMKYIIICYS